MRLVQIITMGAITPLLAQYTAGAALGGFWSNTVGGFSNPKASADHQLIDISGKPISERFQKIQFFSEEGLAAVMQSGKIGFIDTKGKLVIPCQYSGGLRFSEGLASVEKNGKWGYINTTNKTVIPFILDYAGDFTHGYAFVKVNGKGTCIDRSGATQVIPSMGISTVLVRKKDLLEIPLADERKTVLVDPDKGSSTEIQSDDWVQICGDWVACKRNGKWGVVKKDGSPSIPFEFDELRMPATTSEPIVFKKGGLWGGMDFTGKEVFPPQLFEMLGFTDGASLFWTNRGDQRIGIVDVKGSILVEAKYELYGSLSPRNGLYVFKQDGLFGILDTHGKERVPAVYPVLQPNGSEKAPFIVKRGKDLDSWGYLDPDFQFHPIPGKYSYVSEMRGDSLVVVLK
jgi:WG containing repeat